MTDEQFKQIQELFSHQYAMSLAGFSSLAGLLIAGQKQALKGAELSEEEQNAARREGSDLVARTYHSVLSARAYLSLTKDKDPNMQ